MRLLVLDTETTGLNAKGGDRIIEIGCVEIVNRQLTGNNLHFYVNPERDSDPGALAVHGLTTEFLRDKPKFAEIADALRDFVKDAGIIIHNAPFDIGFLNAEFAMLGLPPFCDHCGEVIDTLVQAKAMFPGKRNSLDALCERFGISNAHRTLHGALLDAELLADVYLAMTRGQESLVIDMLADTPGPGSVATARVSLAQFELPVISASDDELAAHADVLNELDKARKGPCVWREPPQRVNETAPAAAA
ncbi:MULTISPECIES: DNA polymerase III subunit epsilon [Burkholderiaceae]|uniref:DNA polymerase III subunit epsilon n=1 Tax=Burkholderiaceae TaxID=119060 RepID=UPI000965C975|nr:MULTISPECIES: DNA polymerase III subunit epsilon [Burkholderiaceae]MCG1017854.1 DNA polymerase III subunit epsilon [Mycetohabitans sp. B4]MCG1038677.1 DNA polymerase III subunit epsilon [Mycetohabitans sp. B7]SIT67697.1 DNA polymerase-3 subunit epsilon [Burkholderia sp. b13]SIT81745.1 DNA polymerase-3 subunit epsilon [Burkholderia sp. b14]